MKTRCFDLIVSSIIDLLEFIYNYFYSFKWLFLSLQSTEFNRFCRDLFSNIRPIIYKNTHHIMRKIYVFLVCLLLSQLPGNLSAQVIFSEDFSTATGNIPPTGWTNNDIYGGGEVWEFDNPGSRSLILPITSPAAVFDSDNYGLFTDEENAALESPVFDASAITDYIFLTFDHTFENYDGGGGGEYFIEVWDGTAWVEVLSSIDDVTEHAVIDITSAVNGATDAQVRFRWTGDWSYWWILDNISVEQVSCLPVTNTLADNETTTSLDISWDAGGSETAWDLEWGPVGFMPGTGSESGSANATALNPYTISGLNPGTTYDVYIKVVCGTGHAVWVKVSGSTLCGPISNLPWSENFDAMPVTGYDIFPNCWNSSEGYWISDTPGNYETGAPANSGANYVAIYSYDQDTLWTPEFQLVAGKHYEFKFSFAGDTDGYPGWNNSVVVYDDQTSTSIAVAGRTFVSPTEVLDDVYREKINCFTPTTSGIYRFGIKASSNGNPYFLVMDDFSLTERGASAGADGSVTVCQTGGVVDLNDVITKDDEFGVWIFSPNPGAIENDSLFNPEFIPGTTLTVNYITLGCLEDTATATITIVEPSNAGTDGTITVCRNEPLNLLEGLSGSLDLGGDWYNPQNQLMTTSQIMAPGFPGQYNYEYVVGNGVCPNDTSGVIVTVTSCDWLSLDESSLESTAIYPNPSTGIVYIESDPGNESFKLVITDINGRVVEPVSNAIANGINTVDLSAMQGGTYFFKFSDSNSEKVYRVVIQ
jgi:hypothetical protein